MTKTKMLQGKMRESGFTLDSLSAALNISRTALFNKVHNRKEFLISEVQSISKLLHLSNQDITYIFFASDVELNSTEKE